MKKSTILIMLFISYSMNSYSKPIVIAHRGASSYVPEHSLIGTSLAHGMDPDFIEPDIVLTKDGIPILLHDINLEQTTNVAQIFPERKDSSNHWPAINFTLREIKKLKLRERTNPKTKEPYFNNRFPNDIFISEVPTLEEVIQLVRGLNKSRKKRIGLYIEMKQPHYHHKHGFNITKVIIDLLKKHDYHKKENNDLVYLQCFEADELKQTRKKLNPPYPLIQLIGFNHWGKVHKTDFDYLITTRGLDEISTYAQGVGPSISHVVSIDKKGRVGPSKFLKEAKRRKLPVHVYTARADQLPKNLNGFDELLNILLVNLQVDGIFTDFTDLTVNFVRRNFK